MMRLLKIKNSWYIIGEHHSRYTKGYIISDYIKYELFRNGDISVFKWLSGVVTVDLYSKMELDLIITPIDTYLR